MQLAYLILVFIISNNNSSCFYKTSTSFGYIGLLLFGPSFLKTGPFDKNMDS